MTWLWLVAVVVSREDYISIFNFVCDKKPKTIFGKSICLYLRTEIMTWLWLVAVVSRED